MLHSRMAKHVVVFGVIGGLLIAVLQVTQYRFLVLQHSLEIYGAIVAALFAGLGVWLGTTVARRREVVREIAVHVEVPVPAQAAFVRDEAKRASLGITGR